MSHQRFSEFNWRDVADLLGGHLSRVTPRDAEVYLPPGACGSATSRVLLFSDNGGELNVSEVVPVLDWSVPYCGNRGRVDDIALACRLHSALTGEPIDYTSPTYWAGKEPS